MSRSPSGVVNQSNAWSAPALVVANSTSRRNRSSSTISADSARAARNNVASSMLLLLMLEVPAMAPGDRRRWLCFSLRAVAGRSPKMRSTISPKSERGSAG